MADLPRLVDKINDIEVSSGAPVTETLNRRFGSIINELVCFLGLGTGASKLAELLSAVNSVCAHRADLIYSPPRDGASGFVAGPFTTEEFVVDRFYLNVATNIEFSVSVQVSIDGAPFQLTNIQLFNNPNSNGVTVEFGEVSWRHGSSYRLLFGTDVLNFGPNLPVNGLSLFREKELQVISEYPANRNNYNTF